MNHRGAAHQSLAFVIAEKPGSADIRARSEGYLIQVTCKAGFSLLVDLAPDLGFPGRMNNGSVLAQNPDHLYVFLITDILDDLTHLEGFILEHGKSRAADDHPG
jgi:hypothetical protein